MHPAQRSRALEQFLKRSGVREPEQTHISCAEALGFSEKPSAKANFPGGATIARQYDRLVVLNGDSDLEPGTLPNPGVVDLPGLRVICEPAEEFINTPDALTVSPVGTITLRSRQAGDRICLSAGTKSLKKLFIDRKIPAHERGRIPVVCDAQGILGVYTIGADRMRKTGENLVTIRFVKTEK